jgi:AraC-like DNA-binding protein
MNDGMPVVADSAFARHVLHGKTISWLDGEQSAPRIVSRQFAQAEITELVVPPIRVAQGTSTKNDKRYHLVCMLDGHGRYRCEAGEFSQECGDIVLINSAEACEVTSPVGTHILRWSLPRELLAPLLPAGELSTMRIPAAGGLNRVLGRHALELARQAGDIPAEAQGGLLVHLCGLIGLTIEMGANRPAPRCRNYRGQVRQRILAYVETHLRDPDLTARRAAEDLGISPRTLYAVLEDRSVGFADLVARRRVERSLALLAIPEPDAMPIAEVAYLSGFEDLSTYYRRFRRYMQMTPGCWRERGKRNQQCASFAHASSTMAHKPRP